MPRDKRFAICGTSPRKADLPETRVKVSPAFTDIGADFAEHLYVKFRSNSAEKKEEM